MGNADTVKAITDNIRSVLKATGIHFSPNIYEDEKNVPASLIPYGRILYKGETFEYTHGQKAGYAEAGFTIRVLLKDRDHAAMLSAQQMWVHRIRESLTVGSMNTGALAGSRYVTRVTSRGVGVENGVYLSSLVYTVAVRYREV